MSNTPTYIQNGPVVLTGYLEQSMLVHILGAENKESGALVAFIVEFVGVLFVYLVGWLCAVCFGSRRPG